MIGWLADYLDSPAVVAFLAIALGGAALLPWRRLAGACSRKRSAEDSEADDLAALKALAGSSAKFSPLPEHLHLLRLGLLAHRINQLG